MAVRRYKGLKSKADKLFSEIIRSVGYCEAEGLGKCSYQLQCAHIISRRYNAVRTDTRNAFSLCAGHHRHYTDHPREFSRFITGTWANKYYDSIYAKSQTYQKVDWQERIDFLNRVKSGELSLSEARELES
jgi:hypothetical protein